jgi:hypothetical protein
MGQSNTSKLIALAKAETDEKKKIEYYKKAANNKNGYSANQLGLICLKNKQFNQATRYFILAQRYCSSDKYILLYNISVFLQKNELYGFTLSKFKSALQINNKLVMMIFKSPATCFPSVSAFNRSIDRAFKASKTKQMTKIIANNLKLAEYGLILDRKDIQCVIFEEDIVLKIGLPADLKERCVKISNNKNLSEHIKKRYLEFGAGMPPFVQKCTKLCLSNGDSPQHHNRAIATEQIVKQKKSKEKNIKDQKTKSVAESKSKPTHLNPQNVDCSVCLDVPRNTIILPCKHLCVCAQCANKLFNSTKKCPVCRAPISNIMTIYV